MEFKIDFGVKECLGVFEFGLDGDAGSFFCGAKIGRRWSNDGAHFGFWLR